MGTITNELKELELAKVINMVLTDPAIMEMPLSHEQGGNFFKAYLGNNYTTVMVQIIEKVNSLTHEFISDCENYE